MNSQMLDNQITQVLKNRLEQMGFVSIQVAPQSNHQFIIRYDHSHKLEAEAIALSSMAHLEFRYLKDVASERNTQARYSMSLNSDGTYSFQDNQENKRILSEKETQDKIINASPLIINENNLTHETKVNQSNPANPGLMLQTTPDGRQKLAEFTTNHTNEYLAVLLDDDILTAPLVREPVLDGNIQIMGDLNPEDCMRLAALLNGGALPVPMDIVEARRLK